MSQFTRFFTNVDIAKPYMSWPNQHGVRSNPMLGDKVMIRLPKNDIEMVVVGRTWEGDTLKVELHIPSNFQNLATFETHVKKYL